MTNKEIEKRLKQEVDSSVPNVLDNILKKCKKTKKESVNIMKKDKIINKNYTPKLVGALASILLVIGAIFIYDEYQDNRVVSTIEFDVNPSIELKIDNDEEVVEAKALNAEGEKVLAGMKLKDTDLDVAVNAIIGSMLKNGYISELKNSILVSVKNDNAKEAQKLQEELSAEIDKILKANSINGSILTQEYSDDEEVKKVAKENNLSEGKTKLINKIIDSDIKNHSGESYKFEDLAPLSITELNLLLNSRNIELDDTKTTGTVNESGYISKEKAQDIAFANAGVSLNDVSDLEVELDSDNGKLIYEVEFDTPNKEYEYEIDATSGEIIRNKTENRDYDDDRYDD